ncbi:hypothetical protein, partial [Xanthomonas vasicola]|uniref:hypothetical protein n=1 Tax=Xanthomonas vasicola TaxID=56459 RepID=UPI001645EDA9
MRPTLCLFLSIATFALPISAAEKKPIRPATANELAMLKAAMQSVLKDPDSAKYESVIVGTKPESKNLIWLSLKNPLQAPRAVCDSGTWLKDGHSIARIQARKNAIQR